MPEIASPDRAQSLRWRLLRAVCLATFLGLALSGAMSYWQARHEAEELMDGHLAQSAELLLALVRNNDSHLANLATHLATARDQEKHRYGSTIEFQIWRTDGSLLLRSERAPAASLAADPGYEDIAYNGRSWRVLTIAAPSDGYRVQVAQSLHLRNRMALEVAIQTVLSIALISPVLLLLIYWSVRRGLKPLDDLAADVAARSPENLQPLRHHAKLFETQPLVAALNRLFVRLGDALDTERRFTADAAHELRTPLAVVKIQAQVAQLSHDADDRQHALAQVLLGVNRATRVLEQLLRLARLDPLTAPPRRDKIDLAELTRRVLIETQQTTSSRLIRLQTTETPLLVSGDAELLEIVLRNLLDNALRYAGPGATITAFARQQAGDLALGVTDDGPGVPPEDLPRLVERFYRGRDARAEGNGLGLAIVQRIAALHAARVEVENLAGGGFEARLCWPGAAAS